MKMRKFVIGVMGPGEGASPEAEAAAERLGTLAAAEGWAVLTGGRDAGVMRAAVRGAKKIEGSTTIGILPNRICAVDPNLDVALFTDMNEARNNLNVLSSDVVVACGAEDPGTASEIALALKAGKPVVLLGGTPAAAQYFLGMPGGSVIEVASAEEAIQAAKSISAKKR
jgi:hypothetical protein